MNLGRENIVMALYPNARGFAYMIFEGPSSAVEWGVSEVLHKEGRTTACARRMSSLIDRYRPDCLVLRGGSRGIKSSAKTLVNAVQEAAEQKGVPTHRLSRKDIQQTFVHTGSQTRYEIAVTIAKHFPMLAPLLPPARKIWNGEDRRMGLFDAAALALTFLGGPLTPR